MQFLDPSFTPIVTTFLFVFGIVFGLLSYMGKPSKDAQGREKGGLAFDKRVNAIIALAFALFSTIYEPLVVGLQTYLPIAVIVMIVIFFALFFKKLFSSEKGDTFPLMIALGLMLVVLMVMGDAVSRFLPVGIIEASNLQWIIGVLIVVLFFWAAYSYKSS